MCACTRSLYKLQTAGHIKAAGLTCSCWQQQQQRATTSHYTTTHTRQNIAPKVILKELVGEVTRLAMARFLLTHTPDTYLAGLTGWSLTLASKERIPSLNALPKIGAVLYKL